MFKPCLNPTVHELTRTWRKRRINLSDIEAVKGEDGKPCCAWCLTALKGRQQKWCGQACSDSAFAWANPQSEYGLAFLLARQGYKCPCGHDWNPLADSLLGTRGIPKKLDRLTEFNIRLVKGVKRHTPKEHRPEVDHITPISKGGSPLDVDNLQILCYTTHKAKSKIDNSGPRKKR